MTELLKEKINDARKNRTASFFKQYNDFNIDWNYIVEEINKSLTEEKHENVYAEYFWKQENNVLVNHLLYFQLISKFPTPNKKINETAILFGKEIYSNPSHMRGKSTVQYFINLVPFNKEMGKHPNSAVHCDGWDVVFIQLVGEATWNIYLNENDKSPIQSELVKPGDVIFIPKGVFHEIYAETPRAGCSLAYPEFN